MRILTKGLLLLVVFVGLLASCHQPHKLDGYYDAGDGFAIYIDNGFATTKSFLPRGFFQVEYLDDSRMRLHRPLWPKHECYVSITDTANGKYVFELYFTNSLLSISDKHTIVSKKPAPGPMDVPLYIRLDPDAPGCQDDYILGTWMDEEDNIFQLARTGYRSDFYEGTYYSDSLILYQTYSGDRLASMKTSKFIYPHCDSIVISNYPNPPNTMVFHKIDQNTCELTYLIPFLYWGDVKEYTTTLRRAEDAHLDTIRHKPSIHDTMPELKRL